MINFAKRQVVANRHLGALGHSSSILFYFQVEEGCGEHLVSTFNALLSGLYLLFTNWVQGPYQEIQAQGFSYSPSLRGLFGKPRACISWYGTSTQLVNSLLHDPF